MDPAERRAARRDLGGVFLFLFPGRFQTLSPRRGFSPRAFVKVLLSLDSRSYVWLGGQPSGPVGHGFWPGLRR